MYYLITYYQVILVLSIYVNHFSLCNHLKTLNSFHLPNLYNDESFTILKTLNSRAGNKYINNVFQRIEKHT